MTREEIDNLVRDYWDKEDVGSDLDWYGYSTQYDNRSAAINYGMIRTFKPSVIVEFGTRSGRCTHDMYKALKKNGKKFLFKPYELEDDMRKLAQSAMDEKFGAGAITIGGDITKADDIPDNIDYLFVDNYHDLSTTEWVFNHLLPEKCIDGCIVQIHDMPFKGNIELCMDPVFDETRYMLELHSKGKLPLEKIYFTGDEEHPNIQGSWWTYKKG